MKDQTHVLPLPAEPPTAYEHLFWKAYDIILFLDYPDGRIIDANPAALKAYDYTREEILALNIGDLSDPAALDHLDEEMRKACIGGIRLETVHRRKDGTLFPVELHSIGVYHNNKYILQSIIRDISANKEIEKLNQFQLEELQASYEQIEAMNRELEDYHEQLMITHEMVKERQEKLELALWGAAEGLWEWNMSSGEIELDMSSANFIETGSDNKIKFKDLQEAIANIHPADRAQFTEGIRLHLQGINPYFEEEYRFKNGINKWVWVLIKGKIVKTDSNGIALSMAGTLRDISDYKQSELEMAAILGAISEHVIYQDLEHNIIWANQAAADSLGLEIPQLIGGKCYRLWHNLEMPCDNCPLTSAHNSGQPESGIITSPDGRVWNIKAYPVKGSSDEITGMVEITTDITIQQQNQEKIRSLSIYDSLTGVYNRSFFETELKRLDRRDSLPISIIMGDVNGLKLVNDSAGHEAGNEILKCISQYMRKACRPDDIVARWGGDEFVILLPGTGQENAAEICDKIHHYCEESGPGAFQPSISLGSATKIKPEQDIYSVLRQAENNMFMTKLLKSQSQRNSVFSSLKATLYERTHETIEHAQRMQAIAMKFGKHLGLPAHEIDRLILLANLHDIGKIAISDDILTKPGSLNHQEWESIKKHPEIGYRIILATHELISIADDILAHHEKWDGSGYPRGLSQYTIPKLARIIAIIDAYDVMTNNRPYKKAMSREKALLELRKYAGTQFDPELVERFTKIMSE